MHGKGTTFSTHAQKISLVLESPPRTSRKSTGGAVACPTRADGWTAFDVSARAGHAVSLCPATASHARDANGKNSEYGEQDLHRSRKEWTVAACLPCLSIPYLLLVKILAPHRDRTVRTFSGASGASGFRPYKILLHLCAYLIQCTNHLTICAPLVL